MKRVATAAVLIPLVLLLVFKAPPWLMALVLALIAWLCLREYFAIVEAHGIKAFRALTIAGVAAIFFSIFLDEIDYPWLEPTVLLFAFGVLYPFLVLTVALFRRETRDVLPTTGASILGVLYVGISFGALAILWQSSYGVYLLLHLLVIVWAGDIAAYYAGKNLGRRKLAPAISPGKTWEGAVASSFAAVLLGTIILKGPAIPSFLASLARTPPDYPLWFAMGASLLINIAAQLGDLIESALKRGAGLKDSGALLPGHGGMLDRVDALLFAAPVSLVVFWLGSLFLFGIHAW